MTGRSRSWVTACLVLFFVGCSGETQHGPSPTGDLSSSPTSTAPSSTTIDGVVIGAADAIGYSVEVPNGWFSDGGTFVVKSGPGVLGMSIWDVGDVPLNPCHWKRGLRDPGPTVADLVGALVAQKFRHASEPAPVTLAGYDGKYIEWSVPADWVVTGDTDFEGCDDPGNGHQDFVSWLGDQAGERYQQVAARWTAYGSSTSRGRLWSWTPPTHLTPPTPIETSSGRSWSRSCSMSECMPDEPQRSAIWRRGRLGEDRHQGLTIRSVHDIRMTGRFRELRSRAGVRGDACEGRTRPLLPLAASEGSITSDDLGLGGTTNQA